MADRSLQASSPARVVDSSESTAFLNVLQDFKKTLKRRDQENFKITTLESLKESIAKIQAEQLSTRRNRNLNRLKPFLEAVEQYGKVVQIFCNSNEIVAFVWVRETMIASGELY
jgi:hypothetical protein